MSSIFVLVYSFFKIGLFGFGGGLAILPMIFQAVLKYSSMSPSNFADLVAIAQITPGPIAINAATFVGFNEMGILGAAAATVAVSVPGISLVLLSMHYLEKFKESKVTKGIFMCIRPVTAALIFTAVVYVASGSLYSSEFESGIDILACGIFALSVLFAGKLKINPIIIICVMGILGAFTYGYIYQ